MQGWLFAFGAIAWAVALVFGINHATGAAPSASVRGADVVAAAAILGFALAGGLCLLGAARSRRGRAGRRISPPFWISSALQAYCPPRNMRR
ncbi:hypothetical protein [Frigoriglobus tundricola]|uniref:Uncharacterized protein n=1 Tax=Frigoriglobus tundricola TaxID=2774151 RepID=A0A6M5YJQ5_9BACT|nr:hypothetical protein [Frigoriglobus tundricola]QJW93794.1 hypothetical protein FTUN_1305 [Frigoriglobus tundricola]